MVDILVYIAVAVIVVLLVWWLLQQVPLPEPARKIVTIVLVVVISVIAISALLQIIGLYIWWMCSDDVDHHI